MGAHRLVSMSTDPGRWALLCVHHQDGLHTAHVLLASAAALVVALGEEEGVLHGERGVDRGEETIVGNDD